ncbi:MAG: glycosyltransferase [Proteobacteria bacterium]|nr:MAG: glycosyltransferase [Pseudomonadota bacterium]
MTSDISNGDLTPCRDGERQGCPIPPLIRQPVKLKWSAGDSSGESEGCRLIQFDTPDSRSRRVNHADLACLELRNPFGAAWAYFRAPMPSPGEVRALRLQVEVFCDADQKIWIEYDSSDDAVQTVPAQPGAFKRTVPALMTAEGRWREFTFLLPDAEFRNRVNGGDFRVVCTREPGEPLYLRALTIESDVSSAGATGTDEGSIGPSTVGEWAAAIDVGSSPEPETSIVIPVFDNPSFTIQCLAYLARFTNECIEVIVVDDGSNRASQSIIETVSGIRLIRMPGNTGFATACNAGAARARGDSLLFLNNDTVPRANWLAALLDSARRRPDAGVLGSLLLYPGTDAVQHAGVYFDELGLPFHASRHEPAERVVTRTEQLVPAVTGACLLTRRALFESLNGFDQRYRNGYEDIDYCLRVRERGHEVLFCSQSILYHYESQSVGRIDFGRELINRRIFRRRWKEQLTGSGRVNGILSRVPARRQSVEAAGRAAASEARYRAWRAVNGWNDTALERLRSRLEATPSSALPRVSVIMPVCDPPVELFRRAIRSVVEQVHDDWELILVDDASETRTVASVISEWTQRDARIRTVGRPQRGGISAASNDGAALATGTFLLFLDHDDEITADAIAELALFVSRNPDADVVYSDHDKVDSAGNHFHAEFKPGWSPELLLSYMYIGHLFAIRRSLFSALGGFRSRYDGSQDYDLALRAVERARLVGHIPGILYHWKASPRSIAHHASAKPGSIEAGRRAVEAACARRGIDCAVTQPEWAAKAAVGYYDLRFPDTGPEVTIVVPTRDRVELLETCISSLGKTSYRNYRILIVDDASREARTLRFLDQCGSAVLRFETRLRFNFSALVNAAVSRVTTPYVVLLNNDTEVISARWLSDMVGYAEMPGVGAVGATLLYDDRRIQHAGVVHDREQGVARHALQNVCYDDPEFHALSRVARNCVGVTAACMMVRRDLYERIGGFDADEFPVAYNDADFCARLMLQGYRSVVSPGAVLTHHENGSRGVYDPVVDLARFRRKYRGIVDPYYNPNLDPGNASYAIAARRVAPARAKSLRVLCFTHALDFTGAPLQLLDVLDGIVSNGNMKLSLCSFQNGPLLERAARIGEGVRVLPMHPLAAMSDGLDYASALEVVRGVVDECRPDVVLANSLDTFVAVDAARIAGVPSVWCVHEFVDPATHFSHLPAGVGSRAQACLDIPYKVIFVSESARQSFARFDNRFNTTVIHNAIPRFPVDQESRWNRVTARRSLGLTDDEVVILSLGTVCERKRQIDLIDALALLPGELLCRLRVFVVGDRPLVGELPNAYSIKLKQRLAQLPADLGDRVEIFPETAEPLRFLRASQVFVCTSSNESFPRVILEALGEGLATIATAVSGITEQIRHRDNGLLFDAGDIAELAALLEELLVDESLRRALSRSAIESVDLFPTHGEMVDRYAEILDEANLGGDGSLLSLAASSSRDASGDMLEAGEAR